MELKYLFTVTYKDGSIFEQPQDDHSELDSKRSAFYDVLQNEKDIELFTIRYGEDEWGVNLITGTFSHNGIEFVSKSEDLVSETPPEFRLVFYRTHTHNFNQEDKELSHIVTYFIGWQCTIDGKNYQQVIGVK